jgi:hypothetical protein
MKFEFSREIFDKYSNTKFHENPSSGEQRCSMRTDERTDMTKPIVAFRNFAHASKNVRNWSDLKYQISLALLRWSINVNCRHTHTHTRGDVIRLLFCPQDREQNFLKLVLQNSACQTTCDASRARNTPGTLLARLTSWTPPLRILSYDQFPQYRSWFFSVSGSKISA